MKILRTMGILALVAGLVLGGASSVFAQGPPEDPPGGGPHSPGKRGFFGTVDSVVGDVITLVTAEGWTVEVTFNGDAKYMVPRLTRGPVDLAGFEDALGESIATIVDSRIAVLATNVVGEPPDFSGDVVRLMLIPSSDSPPSHAHRVGIVPEEGFTPGDSITIIDKDGESHTFTLNGTDYRPSAEDDGISELTGEELIEAITGGCVTVVTKGDPKLPNPIAKAIVLHDELPDWAP